MKKYFTFLIILLSSFIIANSQYWKEIKTIPAAYINNYWLDVFFLPTNPNYGWVCGFNGIVIRTTDGGNSWYGSQIAGAYHLEHIHFPSQNVGYSSGPDGIYKSTNGGVTWSNITPNEFADYWGCYFIDENIGLVIGGGCNGTQRFYRTSNGGQSWTLFQGNEPNSGLTDLILYNPNGLGYAVSSGRLWQTTDGGFTWSVFASSGSNIWQEEITNAGNSFLLPYAGINCSGQGQDGGMRFTTDKGLTWNNYKTGEAMFGSFLTSDKKGWACGDKSGVYYTSDGGENWKLRNCGIPSEANLDDIWFIDENNGYVVGHGVYKLAPTEYLAKPDTLLYDNLCFNESRIDSVYIACKSFDDTRIELSILGDNDGVFKITSPSMNFTVSQCAAKIISVGFFPKENKSYKALLQIDFKDPFNDNIKQTKYIELIGNVTKSTAFPQDTLIVIKNIKCNTYKQVNVPWFVEQKGEKISEIYNLKSSNGISIISTIPFNFQVPTTSMSFSIQLLDTGWHEAKYRFTMQPCSRDTFITIRAYGVSPIISHKPNNQLSTKCLTEVLDTIRVYNTGNDILDIKSARIEPQLSEFTIVKWLNVTAPFSIKQNDYADLIIRYKPSNGGVHSAKIVIENNDSTKIRGDKNPYFIDLNGTSYIVKINDTLIYDFGNICIGQKKILTNKIYNTGNLDAILTILNKFENVSLTFSDINNVIKHNDSLDLNIFFTAIEKGIFNKEIKVNSNPCNNITIVKIKANVVSNELEISPNKISGIVQLGQTLVKIVRINSFSNIDINIKSIRVEPNNPNWKYTFTPPVPMLLLPSQGADFNFVFTPLSDAKLTGKIVIETDGLCPETYYIPIDLSSFNRFVEVNPDNIDFGKFICSYKEQFADITISNKGFTPDTLTEIYFQNQNSVFDFVNLPELPYIIKANEDYILKVRFKKQSEEGTFSDIVIIKTKGDDGQSFEIPLNAEFKKSEITPTYQKYDFGKFELCSEKSTFKFEVTNNGMLSDTLHLISISYDKSFNVITSSIPLGPKETKEIIIDFDPKLENTIGKKRTNIKFLSNMCDIIVEIDLEATIIKTDVAIEPKSINFGEKWEDETISRTIKLINLAEIDVKIDEIRLSDNVNFELVDSPLGKTLFANSTLEFGLNYISSHSGNHNTDISVKYSCDCADSLSATAQGNVRLEKYNTYVYIERYEAVPGDNIDIYVKLNDGFDRVETESINFEISFDKNLFYPRSVESFMGDMKNQIDFSYSDGKISGVIQEQFAKNILKQSGDIIKINGLVLISIPDTTTLHINKFDIISNKNVSINKKDGFLELIDYCVRTGELQKFIMMPKFTVNSGNISQNGIYNFDINSTSDVNVNIKITDLNGISQELTTIKSSIVKNNHTLNLQNFSNGIYFVIFKSKYQEKIIQIINIK